MSELRQPGGISMEQSTHSALYDLLDHKNMYFLRAYLLKSDHINLYITSITWHLLKESLCMGQKCGSENSITVQYPGKSCQNHLQLQLCLWLPNYVVLTVRTEIFGKSAHLYVTKNGTSSDKSKILQWPNLGFGLLGWVVCNCANVCTVVFGVSMVWWWLSMVVSEVSMVCNCPPSATRAIWESSIESSNREIHTVGELNEDSDR